MTTDEHLASIDNHLAAIDAKFEELAASERRRRLGVDQLLSATMDPKFLGAVMKNAMFEEQERALSLSFVCADCHATWTKVSKEPDHSSVCLGCGKVVLPTGAEIARAMGGGGGGGGEEAPGVGAFTPEEAARILAEQERADGTDGPHGSR